MTTTIAATYTAPVSAGSAMITITPPAQEAWSVSQVSIELLTATSGAGSCVLRRNGYAISPAIPTLDAISGDPPVILGPTDKLTVEWTGISAGSAKAIIFYTPL